MKILSLLLFYCTLSFANNYKVDTGHTEAGFRVKYLGISTVSGRFKTFDGSFKYDPKTQKLSDLTAKIDAGSIDTNEADRDKHLRTADFFDVEKFKTIDFVSTKVDYDGKNPSKVHGKLTMRGVTKDIALTVKWGGEAEDPWGNKKVAFTAEGNLDRTDYGLKWNKGLKKAGGVLVGNDVKIVLDVYGVDDSKGEKG